ncbi:hypothetical protein BV210_15985 [Halorientalis sp. IM1011]|uniref:hypothetical protein n=1 Tax=Halorientalis sp. IM1011 TaxID=1932360 RepID=UPI00097CC242|nr:hypothetical protein [Halorientalis sp. IM1011]AQL44113.1 hypothetical protein BV210_15985 [Halorientalis sp. IM1011]
MLDWTQCRRWLLRQRTTGICYLYGLSTLALLTVYYGFPPIPVTHGGQTAILLAAEICLLGPAICGYLGVGPAYPVYGTVVFVFALVVSKSVALPLAGLPGLGIATVLFSVSILTGGLLGTVGYAIGRATGNRADDSAHLLGRSM